MEYTGTYGVELPGIRISFIYNRIMGGTDGASCNLGVEREKRKRER